MEIWRSYIVVGQMLFDRGYTLDEDLEEISFETFCREFEKDGEINFKKLTRIFHKGNQRISTIWASALGSRSLGIQTIKSAATEMTEMGIDHSIIIYEDKATSYALTAIKNYRALPTPIEIEIFSLEELQINITRHEIVDRHICCSKEKKQQLMSAYNISLGDFPKIKITDPICRYYNFKKGQIIKIVSNNLTMPEVTIDGKVTKLKTIEFRTVIN